MDPAILTPEVIGIGVVAMSVAWVINTFIRVRHGYPLENSWGKAVYPKGSESEERVKLLTQENAQLRAELGSIKDRVANVERIVTDSGYHLTHEIESLRGHRESN
ncbi:hypothetical protein GRI62_02865 [Erythrobacter arachoides]|uniref:Uncharacterized protein n=1 Tax=Aurantiacibacter arachoides TaxID=1850444 RepID=A0A845A069_9SPHN|nr:hypothetical protein [Aurantiacibacter arachoides]MXO92546.1 hypothetical protein [Aurantiacibacter arachoides]GGD56325.1 hypothetical protein GCM10011411_15420 [Aurantiacibacter arachoides]